MSVVHLGVVPHPENQPTYYRKYPEVETKGILQKGERMGTDEYARLKRCILPG